MHAPVPTIPVNNISATSLLSRSSSAVSAASFRNGSERRPLLTASGHSSLEELEAGIQAALPKRDTFRDPQSALALQEALYTRHVTKYGKMPEVQAIFPESIGPQQAEFLHAVNTGNVQALRSFCTNTKFNMNFVYPPAKVVSGPGGVPLRQHDGWCRSPLGLLIFPHEGNLERKLPGIPDTDRHELIRLMLSHGADPNIPGPYWASPAVLACLAGDKAALRLLKMSGCTLKDRVEFGTQARPAFTLVHAAALNGHRQILEWLDETLPSSYLSEADVEGNTPLHTVLQYSRDFESAMFLLGRNNDGFALNSQQRSPLSMAIEHMPDFAKELLETKSRFEQKWWGNDVHWFSFQGVILPLYPTGGPLRVRNQDGDECTIEQLIVMHDVRTLAVTPLMQDIIKLKWIHFGQRQYLRQLIPFLVFIVATYIICTVDPHSATFLLAFAAFAILWLYQASLIAVRIEQLSFWLCLDMINLTVATAVAAFQLAAATTLSSDTVQHVAMYMAPVVGFLQVSLIFRLMRLLAMNKVVGPLLIALLEMMKDTVPFLVLISVTIVGFTNGLFATIHFHQSEEELGLQSEFDFSYSYLLRCLCIGVTGDLEDLKPIAEGLKTPYYIGVSVLFWGYVIVAFIVALNLLIALYNTTYAEVCEGHSGNKSWLFLRLQTMLDFEVDDKLPGVQKYYEAVKYHDNRRMVGSLLVSSATE